MFDVQLPDDMASFPGCSEQKETWHHTLVVLNRMGHGIIPWLF
jgi:hypothetical protein